MTELVKENCREGAEERPFPVGWARLWIAFRKNRQRVRPRPLPAKLLS